MAVAGTLLAQKWDYKQASLENEYKHQQEKEKLDEEIKDYRAQVASLKVLSKERAGEAIKFKSELIAKNQANDKLERQNNRLQEHLGNIETDIKNIDEKLRQKEERISELEAARDKEKERAEDALRAREAAEDARQELEIQLTNIQGAASEKEKLLQRSQKELLETKQILRIIKSSGIDVPALVTPAKPVDGFVTVTSPSLPIVMLSVGKDDGVEVGYQFTVYRGNRFIGRVTVEQVYKDACAGRILSDMTVGKIQKGDKVSTRIGRGS